MIRTNDHPPAHMHVFGPDGRAKKYLDCESGTVRLICNPGQAAQPIHAIARQGVWL